MTPDIDRRTVAGLLLALLLLTIAAAAVVAGNKTCTNSYTFAVMGTVCECRFEMNGHDFMPAVETVHEAFEQVLKTANLYDKSSELSRLNASAHLKPFVCTPELYRILCESRNAYKVSDGLFDISVKPLMDLWGFYKKRGRIPSADEIRKAQALCGLDKVIFNDNNCSVMFPQKGMALDLGGIAKGYALDLAVKYLKQKNISIKRGTVNLGGNLYLLGKNQSYRIGIKDPSAPEKIKHIVTLNSPGAVSSSGDYERFVILENRKFGHIIDPVSGVPAPREHAATVFTSSGIQSDWMSTVLYLGGTGYQKKLECQSWIIGK